jgi:hypothetical protein
MMYLAAPQARGDLAAVAAPAKLEVHEVGDFEASFVPRAFDFERLDARFRLPRAVWDALPAYADWGFAVFKLRNKTRRKKHAPPAEFHPMAFVFPRRDPSALFFPTVHVHDGAVHPSAKFDHALYAQPGGAHEPIPHTWERSIGPASAFTKPTELVDAAAPVFRYAIRGEGLNRDVVLHDDELAARRIVTTSCELRWELDRELVQVPEHPSWAREIEPHKRRAAEAFAVEAPLLARQRWNAIDFDASLVRSDYWSVVERGQKVAKPWSVAFPFVHPRLAPHALWLTLSLAGVPSRDEAKVMREELSTLLAQCILRASE